MMVARGSHHCPIACGPTQDFPQTKLSPRSEEVDYGYGDGAPDSALKVEDYGYGDGAPDIAAREKYGYEEPTKFDKGERTSPGEVSPRRVAGEHRATRRSSMKRQGMPRRSSISYKGEIEVNLRGSTSRVMRRTSIDFMEQAEVKQVAPVSELTDEPESLWFQENEYDMMRAKASLITGLAAQGQHHILEAANPSEFCTRGLESHIDAERVYEEQFMAWKSVFLEQHYQINENKYDDVALSQIYQLTTMQNQSRAIQRANLDTEEIANYTKSTRIMMRRLSM